MSTRAWVATRKGLFELQRDDARSNAWRIARVSFLGEPVTMLLPPDPADPQGRMLAALNLGHFGVHLHRSEDAGARWAEVAAPAYPPQREAYDLIYRHGLDVSADGQSLLMGSTTGGLWASSDGGDRWQTVSLNLPPIAAVRFG